MDLISSNMKNETVPRAALYASPWTSCTGLLCSYFNIKILTPIVWLVSRSIGFFGNGNIVLRFTCNPHLRTVCDTLLLNVAVSDLVNIMTPVAMFLVVVSSETTLNWDSSACEVIRLVSDATPGVASYSLAVLSAYHFRSIKRILNGRERDPRLSANLWTLVAVLWTWLLAASFSAPAIIIEKDACVPAFKDIRSEGRLSTVTVCLAYVVVPSLVIGGCYLKMKLLLRRDGGAHRTEELARNEKLSLTTSLLVLLFILCKVPTLVCTIAFVVPPVMEFLYYDRDLVFMAYIYLSCLDLCIKPIVLHFFNPDYVLCCWIHKDEDLQRDSAVYQLQNQPCTSPRPSVAPVGYQPCTSLRPSAGNQPSMAPVGYQPCTSLRPSAGNEPSMAPVGFQPCTSHRPSVGNEPSMAPVGFQPCTSHRPSVGNEPSMVPVGFQPCTSHRPSAGNEPSMAPVGFQPCTSHRPSAGNEPSMAPVGYNPSTSHRPSAGNEPSMAPVGYNPSTSMRPSASNEPSIAPVGYNPSTSMRPSASNEPSVAPVGYQPCTSVRPPASNVPSTVSSVV